MQRLRERISEEEEHAVKQMDAGQPEGTRAIPVLFEEMDRCGCTSRFFLRK